MNKKIILLIIILAFIMSGFLLLIFLDKKKQKSPTDTIQKTASENYLPPIPSYNLPPIEELEKGEKLTIQDNDQIVEVENPYKIAQKVITPQDVLLYSDESFDILYYDYPGQKSFLIDLHGGVDFTTTRSNAESKFLEILKIDKDQACLINVSEGVSYTLEPDLSGKSLGLSFCSPKDK
ncbi:MAG TPA: hypothetical protein GX706_00415 [Candidatus Moranbacteria bacterium]|nr:hypothetical protein [Candidatus Moranbacteria bacterium]